VAEGVGVVVFFGAKDGARANAINHELDAFMHGVYGRDGECDEFGDGGEICMEFMEGMVSVMNLEMGGRSAIVWMAWWGYLRRLVILA
jgi:hypothetical protein